MNVWCYHLIIPLLTVNIVVWLNLFIFLFYDLCFFLIADFLNSFYVLSANNFVKKSAIWIKLIIKYTRPPTLRNRTSELVKQYLGLQVYSEFDLIIAHTWGKSVLLFGSEDALSCQI